LMAQAAASGEAGVDGILLRTSELRRTIRDNQDSVAALLTRLTALRVRLLSWSLWISSPNVIRKRYCPNLTGTEWHHIRLLLVCAIFLLVVIKDIFPIVSWSNATLI